MENRLQLRKLQLPFTKALIPRVCNSSFECSASTNKSPRRGSSWRNFFFFNRLCALLSRRKGARFPFIRGKTTDVREAAGRCICIETGVLEDWRGRGFPLHVLLEGLITRGRLTLAFLIWIRARPPVDFSTVRKNSLVCSLLGGIPHVRCLASFEVLDWWKD